MSLDGHIENGVVVFNEPVSLQDGTPVRVEILPAALDEGRNAAHRRGAGPNDGDWSDKLNERRIELIDKDIQGNITAEERVELAETATESGCVPRSRSSITDRRSETLTPAPPRKETRAGRQLMEWVHSIIQPSHISAAMGRRATKVRLPTAHGCATSLPFV